MIYTAGYAGHTAEQLEAKAKELNALIVDIRLVPWCQYCADWRRQNMASRFRYRYLFVLGWGNENYKPQDRDKGIQIADFDSGLRLFRHRYLHSGADNAILLCGCRDAETCHRSVVAAMLREMGAEVEELDW